MTVASFNATLPWLLALVLAVVAGASCAQSRARVPRITCTCGDAHMEVSP